MPLEISKRVEEWTHATKNASQQQTMFCAGFRTNKTGSSGRDQYRIGAFQYPPVNKITGGEAAACVQSFKSRYPVPLFIFLNINGNRAFGTHFGFKLHPFAFFQRLGKLAYMYKNAFAAPVIFNKAKPLGGIKKSNSAGA